MTEFEHERVRHGHRCPLCRSDMHERQNRRTKDLFFGCVKYPECAGTRDTNGHPTGRASSARRREEELCRESGVDPYSEQIMENGLTPQDFGYDGDG